MEKQEFYKLQASGNDFILLDSLNSKSKPSALFYKKFAKKYCSRKLSIGADGVLVVEPSRKADFKMRIFNADGTEAQMCGNGARCIGFWAYREKKKKCIKFETKAGIIEAKIKDVGKKALIKIKTSAPLDLKMDLPLTVLGRKIKVNYINTGVPHVVIFVESLAKIDVEKIGRKVRFHSKFSPAGANVDFVELKDKDFLTVRTYERGVEAETLACGTGVIASAIISYFKLNTCLKGNKEIALFAETKSKDILRVTFSVKSGFASGGDNNKKIDNVWLEGGANLVYKGKLGENNKGEIC